MKTNKWTNKYKNKGLNKTNGWMTTLANEWGRNKEMNMKARK